MIAVDIVWELVDMFVIFVLYVLFVLVVNVLCGYFV